MTEVSQVCVSSVVYAVVFGPMNLTSHVARLHERLQNLAEATTGSQGRSLIERMGPALEPALTLVVLEALTTATRDISDKLSIESVD